MRIELDAVSLCAPNQRIKSKKEKDVEELEDMLK
jgi:hypothetical protein